MIGEDLKKVADGRLEGRQNRIFAQISESRTGRCIRTQDYLYSVYAPGSDGWQEGSSDYYEEDFLYDLEKDPIEKHNLIKDPKYAQVRKELKEKLIEQMVNADEAKPTILPAIIKRKK